MSSFVNPESLPISNIDDLLSWSSKDEQYKRQSFIKIDSKIPRKQPRVLLCHDMMNGYRDDRFDQGSDNFSYFNFWYWSNIDIFVYFSHNLLSIPPFTWRVAAHRNNRLVLGTLIVEGKNSGVILYKLLSPENFDKTIQNLVSICEVYQFDGYLINFETSVNPSFVDVLYKFLTRLRSKILELSPRNLVIWYDSIIRNGNVSYQNTVNDLNIKFLVCSKAFYINYNWDSDIINTMKRYLKDNYSIEEVFVGIDMFRRNFKSITYDNFMKDVRGRYKYLYNNKLSMALFAIGYLYEIFGSEQCYSYYDCFWKELGPHYVYPFDCFPFKTNFCIGRGKNFFMFGKKVTNSTFINLSLQQIQPMPKEKEDRSDIGLIVYDSFIDYDASYIGGSCYGLKFTLNYVCCEKFPYSRIQLFSTDIILPDVYSIGLVYQANNKFNHICFAIELIYYNNRHTYLLTDHTSYDMAETNIKKLVKTGEVIKLHSDPTINKLFQGGHDVQSTWIRNYCVITDFGHTISPLKEINLLVIPLCNKNPGTKFDSYTVEFRLGELSIHSIDDFEIDWNDISIKDIQVYNQQISVDIKFNVSLTLTWEIALSSRYLNAVECVDIFYEFDNQLVFVGRSMMKGYYHANFAFGTIPSTTMIPLRLQPVLKSGVRQEINDCSFINILLN